VISFMPQQLKPMERGSCTIRFVAIWAPDMVWMLCGSESWLNLLVIEPRFLGYPSCSLLYIPTELSRLFSLNPTHIKVNGPFFHCFV
jgi:hypothetical protein